MTDELLERERGKMKSFERFFFFLSPRLAGKDDAQMDILERGQ